MSKEELSHIDMLMCSSKTEMVFMYPSMLPKKKIVSETSLLLIRTCLNMLCLDSSRATLNLILTHLCSGRLNLVILQTVLRS